MPPIQPVSFDAHLNQYEKQAEDLIQAYQSGDSRLIRQIQEHHLNFRNWSEYDSQTATFRLADAQQLIAGIYAFERWENLATYVKAVTQEGSSVWQFESAIEAIVIGDIATLESLLRANPDLIRMRSMRVHQAMLLHYIAANGVENYRQKSPGNAVDVARILLEAGDEVDALADTYGKGTTLGLVATSVHPKRAGVQLALIQLLLDYGASVDNAPTGWPPLMAALANGCPEAAETLRQNGARVDSIVAAAGLGRLDLVQSFFNEDGRFNTNKSDRPTWGIPKDSIAQLESAFFYACTYGHIDVADFLLSRGVDPNAQDNDRQTSLHCAILGGQLNIVKWLLGRNTPLEVRNVYDGTVLGQALWCVVNGNPEFDYVPIIETLLDAGATIEPGTLSWLAQQDTLSRAKRTRLEDLFQRHGATS